MKITKKYLRKLIKEAINVTEAPQQPSSKKTIVPAKPSREQKDLARQAIGQVLSPEAAEDIVQLYISLANGIGGVPDRKAEEEVKNKFLLHRKAEEENKKKALLLKQCWNIMQMSDNDFIPDGALEEFESTLKGFSSKK